MQQIITELKGWGRSAGVIIPKEVRVQERLKVGDSIGLLIMKKNNVLKESFGKLKPKRSTEAILKEIDEEGWND